jgi:hypothetical protein
MLIKFANVEIIRIEAFDDRLIPWFDEHRPFLVEKNSLSPAGSGSRQVH